MPTFTETKKSYDAIFEKLMSLDLPELHMHKLESHGTTSSGTTLILRATDRDGKGRSVAIRFDGVGYINLPTRVFYDDIKLASPIDSRPIEISLSASLNPPIWVVCIETFMEGGPPAKYFVAAEHIHIVE